MICLGSFLRVFPWEHMWVLCHQLLIQFHCFHSHLFLPSFCPFLLTLQLCLRAPTLPGLGCHAYTVSPLPSHFAPPLNTVDTPSFSKHFPFSASVTSHLLTGLLLLCLLILGIPNSSMGVVLCAPHPEHPLVWPGFDYLPPLAPQLCVVMVDSQPQTWKPQGPLIGGFVCLPMIPNVPLP